MTDALDRSRRRKLVGGPILLVACIGAGSLLFRWAVGPETRVSKYMAVLAKWPIGLVSWFPPSIPPNAEDVRLSAFAGFGQGRPWIELHMRLPPGEVEALEARARAATLHVYGPDHRFSLPAAPGSWPIPNSHTVIGPNSKFPATFKIYVIQAVDRGYGSWDPYESFGVAISRETDEIVYWANQ